MCTKTIPRKHRPKEGVAKWFEVERAPGRFQGREEEVERGGIYEDKNHYTLVKIS
jgi:hypothetical protein